MAPPNAAPQGPPGPPSDGGEGPVRPRVSRMPTIHGTTIAYRDLPGTPCAPGEARAFVRKHLDGRSRLDDMVLVISELVTNAIKHSFSGGGGTIVIVLVDIPGGVRVEVTDAGSPGPGPLIPPTRPVWELTENGQGLRLVAELTNGRWGHYRNTHTRTVWAEITT